MKDSSWFVRRERAEGGKKEVGRGEEDDSDGYDEEEGRGYCEVFEHYNSLIDDVLLKKE